MTHLAPPRKPAPHGRAAAAVARLAAVTLPLCALVAGRPALAWSNHALATREALSVLPEVAGETVRAEPLEAFLADQAAPLEALLAAEEAWALKHVPRYPARPPALTFRAAGPPAGRRESFLAALRVNPESRLGLYVQATPGALAGAARPLDWTEVTALRNGADVRRNVYLPLAAGAEVAALEVVAAASDEPDYGLDVGLWEDSGTAWGRRYGFGPQPFGNPALEFSSQAPFHMGFFHEAGAVYAAAGFLERTFPEHRLHLYRALAGQAFQSGHRYWGWRFAGWALHYLQDLAQPYHARVLPGVGVVRMLWASALDEVGAHGARRAAVTLVSNRHLALEGYLERRLRAALAEGRADDPLLRALRDAGRDRGQPPYQARTLREVVARRAHAEADAVDAAVARAFPARYTSDPGYALDDSRDPVDLLALAAAGPPGAQAALDLLLAERLRDVGLHSRALVRSLPWREPPRPWPR